MSFQIIKPDSKNQTVENKITIFLAGSIEMGLASDWQAKIQNLLKTSDVTIFNPRRVNWDSSWEQTMESPQFRKQVDWELDRLAEADIIFMYLEPGTKSPISLYELGRFYQKNILVCCPKGFYRKGNVDIGCYRDKITTEPDFDKATELLVRAVNHYMDLLYQEYIS